MKWIKTTFLGFMFGGGIGAKAGILLGSLINQELGWTMVELGLTIGGLFGAVLGFVIATQNLYTEKPKDEDQQKLFFEYKRRPLNGNSVMSKSRI